MKPETRFKSRFVSELKVIPNSYFTKTNEVAKRGLPDFLGCVNGFFIMVELKKDNIEEPDDLQKYNMMKAYNAGGYYFVACPENYKDVIHKIRAFNKRNK